MNQTREEIELIIMEGSIEALNRELRNHTQRIAKTANEIDADLLSPTKDLKVLEKLDFILKRAAIFREYFNQYELSKRAYEIKKSGEGVS